MVSPPQILFSNFRATTIGEYYERYNIRRQAWLASGRKYNHIIAALIGEDTYRISTSKNREIDKQRKKLQLLVIAAWSLPLLDSFLLTLDEFAVSTDRPTLKKRLRKNFFIDESKTWVLRGMEGIKSIKSIKTDRLDDYIRGLEDKTIRFEEKPLWGTEQL